MHESLNACILIILIMNVKLTPVVIWKTAFLIRMDG